MSAFNNKDKLDGKPYTRFASENIIPDRKKEIAASLISDNAWFSFANSEFEPFDIIPDRASGGYRPDCNWQMNYTLVSVEYICLEILPDKTIVCHKADDPKIEFVPLNAFKLRLAL